MEIYNGNLRNKPIAKIIKDMWDSLQRGGRVVVELRITTLYGVVEQLEIEKAEEKKYILSILFDPSGGGILEEKKFCEIDIFLDFLEFHFIKAKENIRAIFSCDEVI